MRMVWSQDALQTSSLSHHRTDDTASLCPDNVIKGVCAQENKNSFCNDLFSSQSYSGCALTLVRPSCWVFCFFLGLSAGSSISSCSSVGTDSTGNIVCSSITTIPFFNNKEALNHSGIIPADQIFNILSQEPLQNWKCLPQTSKVINRSTLCCLLSFCLALSNLTFVPVGSTEMVSTLPACPRQQCLAFTLFLSEFHSHSNTVWSREAVRSREVRPSTQKTSTKRT